MDHYSKRMKWTRGKINISRGQSLIELKLKRDLIFLSILNITAVTALLLQLYICLHFLLIVGITATSGIIFLNLPYYHL